MSARRGRPGRAGAAKRGRRTGPHRTETLHIAALTREWDRLKRRLDKASLVIDVPKKADRFAGQPDRQHRTVVIAEMHELTPALGAGPACRVLGLLRASARRCAKRWLAPMPARPARPRPPLALRGPGAPSAARCLEPRALCPHGADGRARHPARPGQLF